MNVWPYSDLLQALKGERLNSVFSPDGTCLEVLLPQLPTAWVCGGGKGGINSVYAQLHNLGVCSHSFQVRYQSYRRGGQVSCHGIRMMAGRGWKRTDTGSSSPPTPSGCRGTPPQGCPQHPCRKCSCPPSKPSGVADVQMCRYKARSFRSIRDTTPAMIAR